VTDADRPPPTQTPEFSGPRPNDWAHLGPLRAHWWIAAGIAIAWLTWPYPEVTATAGLDPSWAIALHLAADQGLDFGRDVLFTYGPLGFLSQPLLVTTGTAVAAFVFAVALQVALCMVLLWSALRTFPAHVAVPLVYVAAAALAATGFSNLSDYIPFLVFVLAVQALERAQAPATWVVPAGAVLAALQLLVKVNGGIICVALLALVVWRCRPGGWRAEGVFAAAFVASLTILWLAGRNSLEALPAWLRESFHIVVSYTDAMAIDILPSRHYVVAAIVLGAAGVLVVAHARALGGQRGLAFAAVCLVYGFAYFKEGFVRLDAIHLTLLFAALAVGLIGIGWERQTRWIAAGLVALSVAVVVEVLDSTAFLYAVRARASNAVDEGRLVLIGSRRHAALDASRWETRQKLGVDRELLRLLEAHTVDVQPYETSAVWAYGLRWRPQLFIQSYMATDHTLDVENARRLASHGAQRILRARETHSVDDKHPAFLAPESFLVLVCHYRQQGVSESWQVLGRARDRCGESRPLRRVSADAGEVVTIPRAGAGELVFARIHVRETLGQRLESLVLKPRPLPRITVDGERFRLVPDTARGPLALRLPRDAGSGFGGYDYSQLVVEGVASPYRIEFYALPLRRG
jgi:hypothetical protein